MLKNEIYYFVFKLLNRCRLISPQLSIPVHIINTRFEIILTKMVEYTLLSKVRGTFWAQATTSHIYTMMAVTRNILCIILLV